MRRAPLISIIDDDESMRESTRGLVRSLGYQVATFASAEEFLKSERVDDTSCLIADVGMPAMSEIDLRRRLSGRGARLRPILIPSFPEEGTRCRGRSARAVDCI